MKDNVYKLSDNSIAQIVRLLQVALLTGTDVSDNLRMLELAAEDGLLNVNPEYLKNFEDNLVKLQKESEALNPQFEKPQFS
jgi:hypothetical protein